MKKLSPDILKKFVYISLALIIIYVSNTITYDLSQKKLKHELSNLFSECYINSEPKDDILISKDSDQNGLIIKVSNNSHCLTIERMTISIISKNQKNDTIDIVVNNKIKPNYDANISLAGLKMDSIISLSYNLKKVSF